MKPHLRKGLKVELPVVVRPWMKPRLEGLVRHPLYSTWAMAYHMETASRMLLAPHLEEHEEAVSGGMLIKHLRPVGVRAHLRVAATLVSVRGSRVYTRLEVYSKNRKIGEGSCVQVVMSRGRFARLLRDARKGNQHGQG
ncbi:MAG: hotdog domain-containing protein [Elusimicrobiota bacterium]